MFQIEPKYANKNSVQCQTAETKSCTGLVVNYSADTKLKKLLGAHLGMVFAHIEKLKQEYTDKYVTVDEQRPELQRFGHMTGIVKTVNMNGREINEFLQSSYAVFPGGMQNY